MLLCKLSYMNALKDRMEEFSRATGWDVGRIAKEAGVSSSAVSQWFGKGSKEIHSIGIKPATNLEKSTGFSALWLSKGVPPKMVGEAKPFDQNITKVAAGLRAFPVISYIQAGRLVEIIDPYAPGEGFAVEYGDDSASKCSFFLEIDGDSMLPDFKPGDRILIDPDVVPRPGDFVAAKNSKEEATFKKYRVRGQTEGGEAIFDLVPMNQDFETLQSDKTHLTIIGTMIEHRRKYRRR